MSARYEETAAEDIHAWLLDLPPAIPATVLDVGAGSGRAAAWLAAKGYDVTAVEPSANMRAASAVYRLLGKTLRSLPNCHADASTRAQHAKSQYIPLTVHNEVDWPPVPSKGNLRGDLVRYTFSWSDSSKRAVMA